MKLLILVMMMTVSVESATAEITGGTPNAYYSVLPASRSADEQLIGKDVVFAINNMKTPSKYVYINRCEEQHCTMFVVEVMGGNWKLVDKYYSLKGVGANLGCGSGQTEPGLFEVAKQEQKAGSEHPNWGNDSMLLTMKPVEGTQNVTRCPHDTEKVIHGRSDLEAMRFNPGRTRGCVGVAPTKYEEMVKQAAQGAVIYNVDTTR